MKHILMPQSVPGRNAKTLDNGTLRIRVEYPDYLEEHGRDRILSAMARAMADLVDIAERSEPSSPRFEYPAPAK